MEEWGTDFNLIVYNSRDRTHEPSTEDTDYILDKFVEAVEKRGLVTVGGCQPARIDIVVCAQCHENEAMEENEYCSPCFDKLAKKLGYKKEEGKYVE